MDEYKEYQDGDELELVDADDEYITKQDLRDALDDMQGDLNAALAKVAALTKQNEQMTMDLILIAASMGADANMNVVMGRIRDLLDREQAYLSITKGE